MDIELNILEKWIRESDNIVFITGKDFSAEAGFPDYRAMDEGYLERYKYPPDEILCFTFLQRNPFYFYRYYRERILPYVLSAQPSPAHEALARLEEAGCVTTVGKQTMGKGRPARVMKILLPEGILEEAEQPDNTDATAE